MKKEKIFPRIARRRRKTINAEVFFMKDKKKKRPDPTEITAAQPDRIPSEMGSNFEVLPPVRPSENPQQRILPRDMA